MPTLLSRWRLLTVIIVLLAVVTTVVVILLPASATPFCQAEKALDLQGLTLSHKLSQAQFTNYVLTEATLEENIGYTEPTTARGKQLAFASDLRALAADPLYYQDLATTSPPSPATMFADPRYKKLLYADSLRNKYITTHISRCNLPN